MNNTMENQSLPVRGKNINLIPTEMAVPARAVKVAKVISKFSVVGSIVLLLVILSLGSYYIYLRLENEKVTSSVNTLKQTISDLSQNEQKLILAKDRLSKITVVRKAESANSEVKRYQNFLSQVVGTVGTQITEATLTTKGTEITITADSSQNLSGILKTISNVLEYERIVVSSLAYNPGSGFVANILFENK
ncbi:MAG: hypothetical protein QY322_00325 [bacterium]|nr:MAG: hypothetical protein QY322_00325 [bacterium]